MPMSDWSTTANSNGSTLGINIAENCPAANVNNALREMMAQLRGTVSTNALSVSGNSTVGGTLGVTGASTLGATLAVTGNTTVGGTFGLTGAATLSSTLAVTGASTLTGNTSVGGTFSVSGTTTLSSTLTVSGVVKSDGLLIKNSATTDNGNIGFNNSNGPEIAIWGSATSGAGSLEVRTAGTKRMEITSAGVAAFTGTVQANNLITFSGAANFLFSTNSGNPLLQLDSGDHIVYDRASNIMLFTIGGSDKMRISSSGVADGSGNAFFTIANDGAGSGLDADLLDGNHASAFALLSSFSSSIGSSGYINLPGGLILQWTNVSCNASSGTAFSWPTAFPNNVFAAVAGGKSGLSFSGSYSAYLYNVSTSGGTAFGNNGSGASSTVSIIAVGN